MTLRRLKKRAADVARNARQSLVNWLLRGVTLDGVRVVNAKFGANTIDISPDLGGIKDLLRWSAAQDALALRDLGMASTGRPSFYVDGAVRYAAHTDELGGGPGASPERFVALLTSDAAVTNAPGSGIFSTEGSTDQATIAARVQAALDYGAALALNTATTKLWACILVQGKFDCGNNSITLKTGVALIGDDHGSGWASSISAKMTDGGVASGLYYFRGLNVDLTGATGISAGSSAVTLTGNNVKFTAERCLFNCGSVGSALSVAATSPNVRLYETRLVALGAVPNPVVNFTGSSNETFLWDGGSFTPGGDINGAAAMGTNVLRLDDASSVLLEGIRIDSSGINTDVCMDIEVADTSLARLVLSNCQILWLAQAVLDMKTATVFRLEGTTMETNAVYWAVDTVGSGSTFEDGGNNAWIDQAGYKNTITLGANVGTTTPVAKA